MIRTGLMVAASLLLGAATAPRPATDILSARPGDDLNEVLARARSARIPTIELAAGVYYLAAPLTITAADSGSTAQPLVIRPAGGARPILSAGRRLGPLAWETWRGRVLRARISGPAFDMLRVGDTVLTRARYPNASPEGGPFGGVSADATAPSRIARWSDPSGGIIHGLHPSRWGSVDQVILGKRTDTTLDLGSPTGINRLAQPSADKRYVENILEELDAPGEWFADFRTGWLYLMPLAGIDPTKGDFVASRLENAIMLSGSETAPVHDVVITGLEIRDGLQTFARTTEPLLRSDWMFYRGGAVLIEGARRVTVADTDIHDTGGNAVVVSGYNRQISIRGNHIWRVGASAIAFVGRPQAVRSPLFEYHESQPLAAIDRVPGPRTNAYPADSDATDNLIHDIGLVEKQSAGVEIAMAERITAAHNSIYRVPRAGINIGDGSWGGHRIVDNDVFDTVLETADHGAFNAWGRDRYWAPDRAEMNRRVAAEPGLPFLDAVAPNYLIHNRFQCDHGWGIDLDDGATNYVIENNVLLSGGLKLREGFRRIARNNIVINSGLRPHVWFRDSDDVVVHNIFGAGHGPIGMKFWGRSVDDNLFPDATALDRARALGVDAHSRWGAPMFLNPASGDYRVARGSPARAIGFRSFATNDFGVVSPRLRALALRPAPPPIITPGAEVAGETAGLLGMTIKKVETLDEQSAAGLPDRKALLVTAIARGSPAERAGIVAGDAILAIAASNGKERQPTATLEDLMSAYRGLKWRGQFALSIFHDQTPVERTVHAE